MKKLITMMVALIAATFVGFAANGEEWYSYSDNRTYWIPAGSNDIWVYYGENQKAVDIKNTTTRGGLTTTTYNIVKIDDYAFNGYGIVENVTIGSGIQTIGDHAFFNCSNLSKITFKGACANINANAFMGLNALTEIVSEATSPVALNGFSAYYSKVKVTVPKGTKAKYQATAGWKEFSNLVEEGETPPTPVVTYINIQIQLPNEWNAPATYTWASGDEIKAMTKAFSIGTFTWWNGQIKANTKFLVKNGANTTDWTYATQDCKGQSADVCMAIGDKMESGRYAATTTSCVEPPAKEPYIESFTVSPTSVQVGNAVTFTTVTKNFSGTPTLTYSVKFGTDEFKAATSPYTPTKAGLYTVKVDAKYNAEEASSSTSFTATAVPPAPIVKYYAKNNWESKTWTWKEMTKDGSVYKLEKVIFGGTGFNFNTKADDADAKWVSADKFTGDAVQANDTVSFTYNPTGDVVTMTLVGRPKEADAIITAINITGNKYVGTELTFTASTYGFKSTPTISYSVKKDGGEYKTAESGKFTPAEAGEYIVKAYAATDTQEASKEQRFTVIAAPVIKSYVAGEFTSWGDGKKELPAEIELDAKKYEFKQITGDTWKGATDQGATMTRGNSAWKLDGEQNVTLDADVKGVYKFELVGDVFTVTYPKDECTWTMVGDNASLFGEAWKPELAANDMEEIDGVFVKSYSNKTFKKDDKIEFKAAKNHAWTTTVPSGDNASYTFTEDGTFDITFSLDIAGDKVNIDVKKFEPEEPTVTSINISGKKYVGEELTFTATVAKFSGEPTITYAVKLGEGEYQAAEGGKFTPDAAGSYTVKATATYESAEGEKEEAVLELPFTVTTAPESIVVKLLASSTTWSEVAIYAFDNAGTITKAWPGDKLTAADGWYSYTIEGEHTGLQIIFNNNVAEGASQTADTPVSASTCYELGAYDETSGTFALNTRECTVPQTTWTMVGNSETLFGTKWNPTLEANDMEEVEGVFTKIYTNVEFLKDEVIEFKAAKNHAWATSIPAGDNAKYTFTESGNFDITFTLDIAGDKVNIVVKKFEPKEPTVTAINIAGSKVVGEELTFTASVAGFSADPMVIYEVKAEEGEYEQAQGGKFTPTAAGNYTVKATAFNQPEEGEAEEAFKEVDFTVSEEPQPGEEIIVKLLASSTTWSEVAIYAFDNAGTITKAWPGDKLTAADGWYSYTIEGEHTGLQIIFNNNVAEGASQTVDTPVSESTCYELGAADESGKFALNVRECTVPETGYGIKIDGETIVMGEKNPKAENEWMILNQSLAKGQTFALYDASTGGTWAVDLDPASVDGIEKGDNSYTVATTGCYSFYLKLIYGADQLYVGTGECGPTQETWIIAGDVALMGSDWDPADENNKMTINSDMISYSLVKYDVALTAGSYEYKAVEGLSWEGTKQVPQEGNNTLTIDATGTYKVEFYLVPGTKTLTAKASIATDGDTPNEEDTPSNYKIIENNEIILVTPNGRCNLIGVPR
ncbi:MAG: starch-binding protein [Paludibacteraceae bacterium]|nr:starch-binding protein [Paludibacteraceae bacterium]